MADDTEWNLMLDPSLLLSRTASEGLVREIHRLRSETGCRIYLPASLRNVFEFGEDPKTNPFYLFYLSELDEPNDLSAVDTLIQEMDAERFEIPGDLRDSYEEFRNNLREPSVSSPSDLPDQLVEVILEEAVFLLERSWIVARIKRAFEKINDAGIVFVQIGSKAFDKLLRLPIKKRPNDVLSRSDKLRSLGKWIAVGSSGVTPFFVPFVVAFVGAGTAVFLLIDPD